MSGKTIMYKVISGIYFIIGLFLLFLLFIFIGISHIETDVYLDSFILMFFSIHLFLSSYQIDKWHGDIRQGLIERIFFLYGPGLLILGTLFYTHVIPLIELVIESGLSSPQ